MAERRMFAKSIVLSDSFLDMPMSARCLYFTLNMLADDDGFVGSPKSIMRQCGASQDDMLVLLQKKYVLGFDNGVIVIKHWRINNYLQKDRYKKTTYLDEMEHLFIKEDGSYSVKNDECIQNVYTGKDRIGKVSIDNIYIPEVADEKSVEKDAPKSQLYKNIIDYLNEKTGKKFRIGKDVTKLIDARVNTGASEQDFFTVIDNMCSKWLNDPKMSDYLRPITLFGNKFDSYLNATPVQKKEDVLPTYDSSKNPIMSEEEYREIEKGMHELMERNQQNA